MVVPAARQVVGRDRAPAAGRVRADRVAPTSETGALKRAVRGHGSPVKGVGAKGAAEKGALKGAAVMDRHVRRAMRQDVAEAGPGSNAAGTARGATNAKQASPKGAIAAKSRAREAAMHVDTSEADPTLDRALTEDVVTEEMDALMTLRRPRLVQRVGVDWRAVARPACWHPMRKWNRTSSQSVFRRIPRHWQSTRLAKPSERKALRTGNGYVARPRPRLRVLALPRCRNRNVAGRPHRPVNEPCCHRGGCPTRSATSLSSSEKAAASAHGET